MAMWALGAFDKMKNAVTEKINFKEVGTRLIKNITISQSQYQQQSQQNNETKAIISKIQQKRPQKQKLSEDQLMEIQIRQYRKLCDLQKNILQNIYQKEKESIKARQTMLQIQNERLLQIQDKLQRQNEKEILIQKIESGQSKKNIMIESVEEVIEQNIIMKQRLFRKSN